MADSRQVVEDYSYDSDSADTVILKDDETFDQCNRAISFFRFMSVEGGQTTDGGLITASESKAPSKPSISPLPSGLSFLTNNPAFLNSTVPPGSFMFTDCRIQMALDEQKSRETSGSTTTFTNSVATKSESNSCSPLVPIDIVPKPVSAPPCEPAPNNIPIHSENGDANSQFKHPNSMQKSDLRCKNREAARKCRAKKKNYIQQLEHDFKTLKEKYAVLQQENDDLKRFIFQHFGVGLAPKPGSKDVSTVPGVTIQPAASAPAVGSSVPVVLNSASGVQVVPVTGAPVIFKDFSNAAPKFSVTEFGLVPAMHYGLSANQALANGEAPLHPAAALEKRLNPKNMLRLVEAPMMGKQGALRLAMEARIMSALSPRLPGLSSQHPLAAQLSGDLDTIGFADVLNHPEDPECRSSVHLLMEAKQKIL